MTGRECYERFVAAMIGEYAMPRFGDLEPRVKAAWDAVADPKSPRHPGHRKPPAGSAPSSAPAPAPTPAPPARSGDVEPAGDARIERDDDDGVR